MNIIECFLSLSRSLDFSYRGLMRHHHRTALIAAKIGQAVGLQNHDLLELFQAAIIHDLGVISWQEKDSLEKFEIDSPQEHCFRGYELLNNNLSLHHLAGIIMSHHDRWVGSNPSGLTKDRIPLASRIIHLADRVDILTDDFENILNQREDILKKLFRSSGVLFDPDLMAVIDLLARNDSFWFDLVLPWEEESLAEIIPPFSYPVGIDYFMDIARLFAQVVDVKCPFTYRHSRGVALIAHLMGEQLGFNEYECTLLKVTGLLHDLGKLAIPTELLEKSGRLTAAEFNLMKQHAYYTYWLLKPVTQAFPLAQWAAYHHERPNGKGYPFGRQGGELDQKARLITVADIYVAMREERPYRPSMRWDQIALVMNELVRVEEMDRELADIILDNRELLDQKWLELS